MYDIIVVGSGPSGGTIASNMVNNGAKVLLIEAGKFFRKDSFPKTEAEYSSQLFWGGGLEFDKNAKTAFLRARVVGGTSIVNQCLLDRFDRLVFDDWKEVSGIDFMSLDQMDPYYKMAEKEIALHTFSESEKNGNANAFTKGCNAAGYKWKFLTRGQSDCKTEEGNDCLACLGGCHRDSKQSSLVISIQEAEKKGLEIKADCEVERINYKTDEVILHVNEKGNKKEIKGRKVVLAGGAFGTTHLMLKSGFKSKLPYLGKGFTQHPQFMLFGVFPDPINAHKGAFQTVASHDPNFRQQGFKLENVYAPPISIGMLLNCFGIEHQKIMQKYTHMACIECAVRDEAVGEIKVNNKGKLVVEKHLTDHDISKYKKGVGIINEIFNKAGAEQVINSPFYFGLHLMGGCAIGSKEETSVVNPNFQVHGFKNIFIADSSIFPGAPGINPSLSIMAFSQKLSENLLKI